MEHTHWTWSETTTSQKKVKNRELLSKPEFYPKVLLMLIQKRFPGPFWQTEHPPKSTRRSPKMAIGLQQLGVMVLNAVVYGVDIHT